MKRILNRIFSVALAAAMTTSPVLAQTAKKAAAAGADPRKAAVAMKAEPRKAQGKGVSSDLRSEDTQCEFRNQRGQTRYVGSCQDGAQGSR